ncbi:DNA polymerase III subunit gamma/tau [Aestuariirhabdus sp. Z084]|uniref:DNA polymerase III subunit gamma/tau n=1 Tax=Aestuariirhabdus haliotis TaxID=2918751 RepID=UPI00201B380F|nr:DNA polymerase III subunit gamma/tau [Aestuariirhabdus haliotis]MCL6417272.1 DNA polymerase III subunit gamma/tau [Aestuariirhabdus haliotis]MCL6421228.1 DNA polymerase III subunit gamma/tau [Aestuariirhabdus haliotis]
MSYQVLARKWRPRIFREMVGQTHVLQALINALDHDRLHHAYLFTGTRGVGKTTIARILAKCLNCEAGVSSEPCGQCGSCKEIEEGRFVDLIEVDAASRTKVEDTRELLDNVQYAPTRGRYKVYLIDEVHMLSTHSFNALLKTLEEPPPHVKFLLATTDPQKLPVTILSRCLQFSLKNMSPERVVSHLQHILEQEVIPFEEAALWQLGRSADGSMRDALSLTDQAIAYGGGRVTEQEVSVMLGTIDQSQVYQIIEALVAGNVTDSLSAVNSLAEFSPDFAKVLSDMLSVMHRMALAQALPDAVDNSQGDRDRVLQLASRVTAEDLHLFYQIALVGRKDLPLAPDPKAGFEMVLLRMLAFRLEGSPEPVTEPLAGTQTQPGSDRAESQSVDTADRSQSGVSVQTQIESDAKSAATSDNPVQEEVVPTKKPLATAEAALTPAAHPVPAAPVVETSEESVGDTAVDAYATEQAYQQYMESGAGQGNELSVDSQAPASSQEPIVEIAGTERSGESATDAPVVEVQGNQDSAAAPASLEVTAPASSSADVKVSADPVSEAGVIQPSESKDTATLAQRIPAESFQASDWAQGYKSFGLSGVTLSIATHLEFCQVTETEVQMRITPGNATLLNATHQGRIEQVMSDYFALPLKLVIEQDSTSAETPAQYLQRHAEERLASAQQAINSDPNVTALLERFSATIVDDSIQPV